MESERHAYQQFTIYQDQSVNEVRRSMQEQRDEGVRKAVHRGLVEAYELVLLSTYERRETTFDRSIDLWSADLYLISIDVGALHRGP